MSTNPLISIVVPVYNGGKYLRRCLDSLAEQSYQNIEVIMIDDASADDSAEICKHYSETDKRFHFFQNEINTGVCNTRNRGIALAKGEFIAFVDNDDLVDREYIQTFLTPNPPNEDTLVTQRAIYNVLGKDKSVLQGLDILGCVWAKLFSKHIIDTNNIKFIPDLKYAEDSLFCLEYIDCVKNVVELPYTHYKWMLNRESTSLKRDTDIEALSNGMKQMMLIYLHRRFNNPILKEYTLHHISLHYHKLIKGLYQYENISAKQRRQHLRKIVQLGREAIDLYPHNFRSDSIVQALLRLHLVRLADYMNVMLWQLRKHKSMFSTSKM